MTTKGFYINSTDHDESVGIFPQEWKLEGDFHFEDEESLSDFAGMILTAFTTHLGQVAIETFEEREEAIRKEQEIYDRYLDYDPT